MTRSDRSILAPFAAGLLLALSALLAVGAIGEALAPGTDQPAGTSDEAQDRSSANDPDASTVSGGPLPTASEEHASRDTQDAQGTGQASTVGPDWLLGPGLLLAGLSAGVGTGAAMLYRRARSDVTGDQAPEDAGDEMRPDPGSREVPAGVPGIMRLGQEAVDNGEYERAAAWFSTALELEPELGVAHLCLGLCHAELDRPDEALAALGRATDLRPTDPIPRYKLAQVLASTGHASAAVDELKPLIEGSEISWEAILDDPAFEDLRDHPRFQELSSEFGGA